MILLKRPYLSIGQHVVTFLVNNELDAYFFFFRIYLFQFSKCFEHICVYHQENQLYYTTPGICHSM